MATSAELDFVTLDVFTSKPYQGNPLAIVRIPSSRTLTQEQKQAIAREFNLSETTFLHENAEGEANLAWTVDIFMTSRELPFAGHPTVGTACYVLGRTAQAQGLDHGVIEAAFSLKSGPVRLQYDVAKKTAKASIPHDVHVHEKRYTNEMLFKVQPQLEEAHSQGKIKVKNDFPIVSIVKGMTFVLVELESVEALAVVSLAGQSLAINGLDEGWDETFVGMYFFVRVANKDQGVTALRTRMIEGPLEDPATGSAASDLAAYLSLTEGGANKTFQYEIVQGVEMGRRSEILIDVDMNENGSISEVRLEGGAVQVMKGQVVV
ncbi:hypothetical protein COCCADRAFT_84244 [Bipolaris zeicola 26-R-13]|uniref:Phenazine biosynthesis protein n=1 Tax=Cochliobolus carbonum (strain 26-R-13) TaxID=930089 RepID=W6Z2S2_COCC2|nr:uncharacterized protein COCCADRAFT_84244 [Bipolaris zeicola 26-R-13]EUC37976.1 hypothetical protein COCCADRAFT_84244 [Bipolaris zeicola 26-R-13]